MWRPWFECNTLQVEEDSDVPKSTRVHLSPESKQLILNVFNTLKEEGTVSPVERTSQLTKVPLSTVGKIVRYGVYTRDKRNDSNQLRTLSHGDLDVIRRKVYKMYEENILPSLPMLHQRLINDNAINNCALNTLRSAMTFMGFRFKKVDKRKTIMETHRLQKWRHEYLLSIHEYREQQRPIIYLDETWFDTYDTISKSWTDNSRQCQVDVPASRGKRVIILHAGSQHGWINNCRFLSAKNIRHCNIDYHDNMSAEVFEEWFSNKLLPNIPPNSVIVMDNASYHSRQINKVPTISNNKSEIMEYLYQNNLYFEENYNKLQLLEVVKTKPVQKQYFCDSAAETLGHTVLRLPPYYCIFNPIEMIWSQLKSGTRKFNSAPTNSNKVVDLINTEIDKITEENWKNCVRHVIDIEKQYIGCYNITNQLIIRLNSNDLSSDSDNEDDFICID